MAGQDWTGAVLGNTYRLECLLGKGGMGAVYAASHIRTGQRCAVKLLHREAAEDEGIYRRFVDEATIASRLKHAHIVTVSDFAEHTDGTPYMVMELLDGQDLASRLREGKRLSLDEALRLAAQVGSALQAAHDAGIVHRDIKPQNIFLVRSPSGDHAKVVDFGISKVRDRTTQLTGTDTIMGTPQYMSPEAALAQNAQLDGRADQFSLAVVLYQMLSGVLPFQAATTVGILYQIVHAQPPPLAQFVPGLPAHVPAAIMRALAKGREGRFSSIQEFLDALNGRIPIAVPLPATVIAAPRPPVPAVAGAPGGTTLSAAAGHHAQRPSSPSRRIPLLVVALLALSGGGFALLRGGGERTGEATPPIPGPDRQAAATAPASVDLAPLPAPPDLAVAPLDLARPASMRSVERPRPVLKRPPKPADPDPDPGL